jgi:tellurite resistance protein
MKAITQMPALPDLSVAQAVMSIAVIAATSDGKLSPLELNRLRCLAGDHPLFSRLVNSELFISDCAQDIRSAGVDAVISKCEKALSQRMQQTAFAIAVDLVQVDGSQHQTEHQLLKKIVSAFNLPGPLVRKIHAVTEIRQRTC